MHTLSYDKREATTFNNNLKNFELQALKYATETLTNISIFFEFQSEWTFDYMNLNLKWFDAKIRNCIEDNHHQTCKPSRINMDFKLLLINVCYIF